MIRTNSTNDSKVIPACRFKDQTDALLKQWLSLPPLERDRKFIDTARAAVMAGVTRRTIQAWIDAGEIRALCIGRKLHVDSDSLCERIQSEARVWAAGEPPPARQARKRNSRSRSI
jgi:excisionase family DNA binding protein